MKYFQYKAFSFFIITNIVFILLFSCIKPKSKQEPNLVKTNTTEETQVFVGIPDSGRNPLINKSTNPFVNHAINPDKNNLLNPKSNSSINPNENTAVNPMINEQIHPGIQKEWSYMDNQKMNPQLTTEIRPSYAVKFNPNSKEFEGIYIFDKEQKVNAFACKFSNDIMLIYNTNFEFSKIAVSNKNKGFNLFNTRHEWLGFMISDENDGFLLFDTQGNWEFFAH